MGGIFRATRVARACNGNLLGLPIGGKIASAFLVRESKVHVIRRLQLTWELNYMYNENNRYVVKNMDYEYK